MSNIFIDTIAFMFLAALTGIFTNLISDQWESRRGDMEIKKALRDWRKAHPDAPPPTICLKDEK